MKYDLAVVGLGYIGLPTASIFATRGKNVLGVDIRPDIVQTINDGRIHIVEPELDVLVRSAVHSGNLRADTSPASADTFIIAVPTPFKVSNQRREPDLSYVEAASRLIAPVVMEGDMVILESTSPVGTTEKVRDWIQDERSRRGLPVIAALYAHCPERILPGQMIKELVSNDRICGGLTPSAAERACELYRTFCVGEILLTDARTAEMVKLTENASRDVSIAFANELSVICDRLSLDVWEVIRLANHHPRVKILQPGPGVGGHCIAVDPWFIVDSAPEESRLIRTAREVNDAKPEYVLSKVRAAIRQKGHGKIACLGLAFKADIDDLRESPSLEIAAELAREGYELLIAEPHVQSLPASLQLPNVMLTDGAKAVAESEVVVLLVNHRSFAGLAPSSQSGKIVIDTRGMWRGLEP
jgi:UDP-N-acetyl-D-mannosaminuronic acid dehydrogenase